MTEQEVLDFNSFSGGFEITVDIGKTKPIAFVVLTFPNGTTATIRGDEKVVKQIVDRLDGLVIEYETPNLAEEKKG